MNACKQKLITTKIQKDTRLGDIHTLDASDIHHTFYTLHKLRQPESHCNVDISSDEEFVEVGGFHFCTLKNDTCVSDALRSGELFEKFYLSLLSTIIPKDKDMLDIGANIGVWTVVFSKVTSGFIHSFEPQPKIFDCLSKNNIINNCTNVRLYNTGLSDKDQILCMNAEYDRKENFGAFRICDYGSLNIQTIMGDFLELNDVGFIKVDVEGHELEALTGLEKTIRLCKPILFVEIHDTQPNNQETLNKILSFGYTHVSKLSHCDYLFSFNELSCSY